MMYKLSQNQSTEEEDSRKKRSFVLKVADNFKDDIEGSDSENEDELTLITRGFRKILKGRGRLRRGKLLNKTDPSKKKEKDIDQQITCYGCKKIGHYKNECPQLKKAIKSNKKKAMVAFWGGSDISSSDLEEENEEVANLCFYGIRR